jgi:arylsulfatase A-like enzyme
MRGAGYRSALFGKWHLGSQPDAQPLRQGFDVFIGNLGGHVDHISRRGSGGKYDWHNGFELFEEKGYVAHLLTAHALDFIRENQENPFFILLSHACPHGPIQLPGDRPIYIETGIDRSQRAREDKGKYPQMIGEMDAGIGSILDELERLGLDEKTLVIFTSDNGPHPQVGSAGPYRGKKAELYEGGHRVPFAARWPGTIPGGSVRGDTAMLMDLLPTFLDLAGLEPPAEPVMDGISLYPLLRRGNELPRRTLFWDNVGSRAVRDGIWKMVSVRDRPAWRTELYRLDTDPGEARDLSQEHPEILERLRHSHDQWAGEMRRGAISQPFYKPQNESGGSK